ALAIHPDVLEVGDQAVELGGRGGVDLVRAVLEFDQGGVFAFQCLVVGGVGTRGGGALAFQGLDPVVGGGGQGPVGGQERFEQGVGEATVVPPDHGPALTGVAGQPHLGEFGEDILLGGAGDDPDGGGRAAVGPLVAHVRADLGVDLGAADVEVCDLFGRVLGGVGDRGRVEEV